MSNYPNDVSATCREAPWNQKSRSYIEIDRDELIDLCGGRAQILGHDDPFSYMITKQQELVDILLCTHDEVGEVHPETIQDYVDAIIEEETP